MSETKPLAQQLATSLPNADNKVWYYAVPYAMVSLNDAYGMRGGRHAHKFLKPQYEAMKASMKQFFEEQDLERGKPTHKFLDCTYLFAFSEEELFTASVTAQYQRLHDSITQKKDTSNGFKIVEDSLHEYFEIDDSRVFRLEGVKVPFSVLPMTVEDYSDEPADRGNILIAVQECIDFSAIPAIFEPVMMAMPHCVVSSLAPGAESMAPAKKKLPTWYATPGAGKKKPSEVVIDMTEEHERYMDLKSHQFCSDRYMRRLMAELCGKRVTWQAYLDGEPEADEAEQFFNEKAMLEAFKVVCRDSSDKQIPINATATHRHDFGTHKAWVSYLLRQECTTTVHNQFESLRLAIQTLRDEGIPHPRVLIYGAGIGTYVYPFQEFDCDLVLVGINESETHEVLQRRLRQDSIVAEVHTIDYLGAMPEEVDGYFDCIVAMDVLDKIQEPFEFLDSLVEYAESEALFFFSYNFKRTKGRKKVLVTPWNYDDEIQTSPSTKPKSRTSAITQYLSSPRAGLAMELYADCQWKDDVKILVGPTVEEDEEED